LWGNVRWNARRHARWNARRNARWNARRHARWNARWNARRNVRGNAWWYANARIAHVQLIAIVIAIYAITNLTAT